MRSSVEHTSRMLREMLQLLHGVQKDTEGFRTAVQAFLRASHGLDHEDEEVMAELTDEILLEKLREMTEHLVATEKLFDWLSKYNPRDPR